MFTRFSSLLRGLAVLAVLACAVPAAAQTALTSTTLTAAIADGAAQSMALTSATGFTAPGTGSTFVFGLIDREIVGIRSVSGLVVGMSRGQNGTRATPHISGATVWAVPPQAILNYVPSGQCTRSTLSYVPAVIGGTVAQGNNGDLYDCLGVTTAGQWVQTNGPGHGLGVLGTTMASTAGVLGLPTGTVFTVSGTNAITGITLPAGAGIGFRIGIVPSGVFTWTAATNIALAGTAVVNKLLEFVWNGSKWVPSYIA